MNTVTLKKNHKLTGATLASQAVYKNLSRYTSRAIPAAGALLKEENPVEVQLTLE